MCLLLEVLLPGVSAGAAGALPRDAAAASLPTLRAERPPRETDPARFVVGDGCSCQFLGDDADWHAPYYSLAPDQSEPLSRAFEFLGSRAGPMGMYVRARWLDQGYEPLTTHEGAPSIALADLLADVRAGRIANARAYRVLGAS